MRVEFFAANLKITSNKCKHDVRMTQFHDESTGLELKAFYGETTCVGVHALVLKTHCNVSKQGEELCFSMLLLEVHGCFQL